MTKILSGPWDEVKIGAFLQDQIIPMRLSCVGEDGFPRVVSVWFGYDGEVFRSVSHQSSQLVKLLRRSEQVGFEIAADTPPYRGVRGQGVASLSPQHAEGVLNAMLQRYLGGTESSLAQWLLSRVEEEVVVTISPLRLFSWDYSDRMQDA